MSLSPSFRLPPKLGPQVDPDVAEAIGFHDDAITDLQQAIPSLKSQIDALKPSTATPTAGTNTTTSSETVITQPSTIGAVNNQTGVTSYATLPTDYGAFILLSDASPVAVTLSQGTTITPPWFAIFLNYGVGLATLTPATGTITYPGNLAAASMPLPQNVGCMVVYDGANFDAVLFPVSPQNTPGVAHKWVASYNSTTGVFTLTQPAFTDVSGIATVAQGGTGTSSPALIPGTNVTITGTWPNQTINASTTGLSVTITTAALTSLGTQGSMTFVNGLLTAQVQAT